jgi:hypothetical protein
MKNEMTHTIWRLATLTLIALLGVSAIGFAQEDTWTKKADMPFLRNNLSTSVVNGKIYAIGAVRVLVAIRLSQRTTPRPTPGQRRWICQPQETGYPAAPWMG